MELGRSLPRKVLGYLDHSDPRLAKTKSLQFKAQETKLEDTADISSVGRIFKDGDSAPSADPTMMIFGGLMGTLLTGVSVIAPGPLLAVTLPTAGYMLKSAYSEAKNMKDRKDYNKSNLNFQGSRTWELESKAKTGKDISSPLLAEDPTAQPSREDFQEFIDTHADDEKDNTLILNGHGTPGVQARVGSFPISSVSTVLKKRLKETGLKMGLIVLDSCQLGNLSVLKALEGTTDYLVASQADIDVAVDSDPRKSFDPYRTLLEPGTHNQEVAHKMVDEARGVSTLAAYDMTKTEPLFESLDNLGTLLHENNDRKQVRRMLDAAAAETKVGTQHTNTPSVVDLGAFCRHIRKMSQHQKTKKAASDVLKLMDEVVTRKKTSGKFMASSHISFQNPNKMAQRDRNELVRSRLPEGWKNFLRSQIVQRGRSF